MRVKNYSASLAPTSASTGFKNDFVYKEEYNHRNTAVKHGSTDIVEPRSNEVTCNSCPNAVDRVNDAGYYAEREKVPETLVKHITVGTEYPLSLNEEVDNLTDNHCDHVSGKVCKTALICAVADYVPLEFNAEESNVDAGETEVLAAHKCECKGKEGEKKVLENGDYVTYDNEKSTLSYPLRCLRILLFESKP